MSSNIFRLFTTIFLLSLVTISLCKATNDPEPQYIDRITPLVNLTEINFDDHVVNINLGPWFVMFYAPWCSHSKAATPAFLQLAKKLHGEVNVAIVDCEANNYLKRRFGVSSYPTFIYYANNTMYEYKGERSVNSWLNFVNEGYKNVEPEEIPMKASTLREVTKEVRKVYRQFMHAVTNYPLFVLGVFGFIILMTYISFSCTQWANEKLGVNQDQKPQTAQKTEETKPLKENADTKKKQ